MDIFSDDEPDLMSLDLVREFDNLRRNFYSIFDEDINECRVLRELHRHQK